MGKRLNKAASLPITQQTDPYAGFDNGDDSDEEQKPSPILYVRGKSPTNVEDVLKIQKCKRALSSAKLAFDKSELAGTVASTFDANKYFHKLTTCSLGHTCLTAGEVPSTQTLLKENFDSVPVGTVMVADVQDAGKGRGGNEWTSPRGCLMFSFTTQVADGATLPFLQYVVALSIVQAIQQEAGVALSVPFTSSSMEDVVDVRIKWPNDVYGPRAEKIGGVLCESGYDVEAKLFNVTVGCGVNVKNTKPTTCIQEIIKDREADILKQASTQRPAHMALAFPTRELVLGAIMNTLEANLRIFKENGFEALKPEYLRHWLHSSQAVTLMEAGADGRKRMVPLVIRGLTPSGYLLATDKNGDKFELHPDGNSLDFFAGLVRRRMSGGGAPTMSRRASHT